MKRILQVALVAGLAVASLAQWTAPPSDVPAFNAVPPAKGDKLPPILTADQLTGEASKFAYQAHTYKLASKVGSVLYQLPCYCHCDRGFGHKSLRSCFEGLHGAHCGTCMQEAVYAYQMTKMHKTAKQIRDGINNAEYQNIDLPSSVSIE